MLVIYSDNFLEDPFILNKRNWSEQKNRWHEEKRLQFRPENLKKNCPLLILRQRNMKNLDSKSDR